MSGIEFAAAAVVFLSGGSSFAAAVKAYRPQRATADDIERMSGALQAAQPDPETEPLPDDFAALLARLE
ncbi:hypothetical protein [Sphingomonas sp. SRS2]|uniref:hypothetical protein n=1 Tax=Sphingomonas sp. SRS2 TaxID=133190 RepID=UPI00061841C6|nr:hypothetical protein [Sphingomonas sp. SRS2]KKC24943.1 hypothetical protein WP12_17140 [Sphingomonas sp. SRS2]